ncbi:hypothetical protein [Halolamina rubra]|uniref:hypothetical protein n=1 Tax=Halolamina rubra TaxID=1380430 RepID=UPI000679C3F8|nr:hypothetical protein [Halolamina rubra]
MIRRLVVALLVVTAAIGAGSMGVAAQSDDGAFFDGLIADDDDQGILEEVGIWVAGATSGASRTYAAYLGDGANASTYAEEFTTAFNEHNASLEAFASERLTADTNHDVFAVHFHDREEGNVTRYVVSDVENGSWTNARVLTPAEFDTTNRSADQWVSLDWYQSRAAGDELETFVEDQAEPNEDLSPGDKAAYLAKYGAPESSMWNTTEEA